MRLLWLGNPPFAGSGYGEQAALFGPRIKALGHEIAYFANWGLGEGVMPWNGIPIYPADNDYGNTALGSYTEHFRADLVVALCDAWVLRPETWPQGIRAALWAPVDHYPIPPAVLGALKHDHVQPVAMSRFGEKMMSDCELDPLYVPHGVDTELFKPRPEIKADVRRELGIPADAFLVGMVAANKSAIRKGFSQALLAFSQFAKARPDAWLYAHTDALPRPGAGGLNFEHLVKVTGCPDDRVKFPSPKAMHLGIPREVIANLYAAFDVLLMPSMGEGFGIPLIEAQASGVPVITSNHSAMSELCHAGWLVNGDPWWDAPADSFFIVPSIASIVAALDAAYEERANEALRREAREFALGYDADLVTVQYWEPALAAMESASSSQQESRQVRRARERREAKQAQRVAA